MRNNHEQELTEIAREAVERGAVRKVTIVHLSGLTTKLKAPSRQTTLADADLPGSFQPRQVHIRVLAVLTPQPQQARTIARLAGYRSIQHVYQALSDLKDAGKILHNSDGYYISAPNPQEAVDKNRG